MRAFLLALCVLFVFARPTPAQDNEARTLIEKGIQALGGDAKVAKLRTLHAKYEGIVFRGDTRVALKAEMAVQLPGQFRMQMDLEVNNRKVSVLDLIDGDKGVRSTNGDAQPLKGDLFAAVRRALRYLHIEGALPELLKDKAYTLSPLGELKVNDRPALGVKVSRKGRADVDLFFDKDNNLPVKVEWKAINLDLQQEVAWEVLLSNRKETDGVKCSRGLHLNIDGKKYMEMEVSEIRFVDRIDDSTFTRP